MIYILVTFYLTNHRLNVIIFYEDINKRRDIMTVPLIVELIFRFVPSTLLVFGFIDINLTPKYNKCIQLVSISAVYLAVGIFGYLMRENYRVEVLDFVLAVILVICYSVFFHTDSVGYRVFIGTLVYLSLIIFDTVTSVVIFVLFPDLNLTMGHVTYQSLLVADVDLIIYGILMYLEYCVIRGVRNKKAINRKALIFMLFPTSQVLILSVIIKLIMADTSNATSEIMYFTLSCIVICVISDVLCYRGLIQNSQLYETKMRNEQLEYERSTQYRYYEKINELQHEIMKYRHDFNNVLTMAMNLYTYPDTAEKGKEMLDELSRKNQSNKMPFYCANNIVNAILWDKSNAAKESGVTLGCDVSLSNDISVDDVDLCCLIVNMLDNAIRGAKEASDDKNISIKIKEENERIYVSVSNYADMPDFESAEKLPSTKANKNHGYGTEIIRNIVQKYDGDVLFTCKDKKFSTALSIRINEREITEI